MLIGQAVVDADGSERWRAILPTPRPLALGWTSLRCLWNVTMSLQTCVAISLWPFLSCDRLTVLGAGVAFRDEDCVFPIAENAKQLQIVFFEDLVAPLDETVHLAVE